MTTSQPNYYYDAPTEAEAQNIARIVKTLAKTLGLVERSTADSISKPVFDRDWRGIQEERAILASTAPAPLFSQQQQVLTSLVAEWDEMNTDERKRVLAAVFECITASAEGVDRLEPAKVWRPQRLRWSRVSDGRPPCAIDREVEHVRPAVVAGDIEHPVGG
jgi:hypothetical protein